VDRQILSKDVRFGAHHGLNWDIAPFRFAPEPDVTQSFVAGSWTRSISTGADHIGLVAQLC
jgi:hypothetical protein